MTIRLCFLCLSLASSLSLANPNDTDQDGVVNAFDECEATKPGALTAYNGCEHDSDNDGRPDHADQCPNAGAAVLDATGCPLGTTVDRLPFDFAPSKTSLPSNAKAVLGNIAATLTLHPHLHLNIDGYTDSSGKAKQNQKLSLERAEAVKYFLISLGIDESRLTAKGHGSTQPLVSNNNASQRRYNRRIAITYLNK